VQERNLGQNAQKGSQERGKGKYLRENTCKYFDRGEGGNKEKKNTKAKAGS